MTDPAFEPIDWELVLQDRLDGLYAIRDRLGISEEDFDEILEAAHWVDEAKSMMVAAG